MERIWGLWTKELLHLKLHDVRVLGFFYLIQGRAVFIVFEKKELFFKGTPGSILNFLHQQKLYLLSAYAKREVTVIELDKREIVNIY